MLIITIGLLLSGDVHPCPGPSHTELTNNTIITAETTRSTSVSQVRAPCLDKLPFDHKQDSNLCFLGGFGVVPSAWSVNGPVVTAEPGASQCGTEEPQHAVWGRDWRPTWMALTVWQRGQRDGGMPAECRCAADGCREDINTL